MKTILVSRRGAFKFNPEDLNIQALSRDVNTVDDIYMITEACDIKRFDYDNDNDNKILHAEPGDILVTFYSSDFPNKMVLVKNEDWKKNIEDAREREQKRKEEWAAKQANEPVGECDECCLKPMTERTKTYA